MSNKGDVKNQPADERFGSKQDQQKRQDSDRQQSDQNQSPSRTRE